MERYTLNDQRAFAFLTRLSQHQNIKLHRIAEQINDTVERPPEK
jgi:AmiR/NasT family two-component response regulator